MTTILGKSLILKALPRVKSNDRKPYFGTSINSQQRLSPFFLNLSSDYENSWIYLELGTTYTVK